MFFEEQYEYTIIEDVSKEELENFSEEQGINAQVGIDNSLDWAIFAQYYGANNGLNHIASVSFAHMVSLFLSGMGVSASTEFYLKEEQIEFNILDALNKIKVDIDDEIDQVKTLFEYIFILYKDKLHPYWKKTERLDFRLSYNDYNDFMSVPGETKSDKLNNLLENYY